VRLKAAGYEVVTAVDGITAVSTAQKQRPDVLVLDIGLPSGDGFMVLERFRAIAPLSAIPIIVLSAMDPATNKQRALNAGAVDYLQKPAEKHQLLKAIEKALGKSIESARNGTEASAKPDDATRKKTILIVDDDPDILQSLSIRLKATGYNTVVAADSIAAVARARRDKPDLILLDIGMPGGDGYQVMERLKAVIPEKRIPIIVVTAKEPTEHKEKALQMGARAFLQKPVDNSVLLAEISKALERK